MGDLNIWGSSRSFMYDDSFFDQQHLMKVSLKNLNNYKVTKGGPYFPTMEKKLEGRLIRVGALIRNNMAKNKFS